MTVQHHASQQTFIYFDEQGTKIGHLHYRFILITQNTTVL